MVMAEYGNNKKIGIITLHYIPNEGAVLQSYALQTYLRRYLNTEIIDYRLVNRERNFSINEDLEFLRKSFTPKKAAVTLYHLYSKRYFRAFRKVLNSFYSEEYHLSTRCRTKEDLRNLGKEYDAIVVGSDQVWNPNFIGKDYSLMLDFYDGYKFSYASSVAVKELNNESRSKYKKYLSDFQHITVREQEGADLLNEILGDNSVTTKPDPTFLLTKEEWEEFANTYKNITIKKPRKYIFVYSVKDDSTLLQAAEKLSEETGYPVIYTCSPAELTKMKELRMLHARCDLDPREWLSIMADSEIVLTNSFHGIALSNNLEKNCAIHISNALDVNHTNSRLTNIVKILHLEEHVFSEDIEEVKEYQWYATTGEYLKGQRDNGQRYLKQVVNEMGGL